MVTLKIHIWIKAMDQREIEALMILGGMNFVARVKIVDLEALIKELKLYDKFFLMLNIPLIIKLYIILIGISLNLFPFYARLFLKSF